MEDTSQDTLSRRIGSADLPRENRTAGIQLALPLGFFPGRRNLPAAAKACLYCGGPADTRDHVPPKALLLQPYPPNLRTVPACAPCNTLWSLDEQYLAVILAHLTEHPGLQVGLEAGGIIDRALAAAPMLDDRITDSLSADGSGVRLAPELGRMQRIAEKMAHGLHCLKYGTGPRLGDFRTLRIFGPGAGLPQRVIAAMWNWAGLRRKRWTVVQEGVFSFLFSRGWMDDDPPLYCFIDLAGTLLLTVGCPSPSGKPAAKRLRSKPWA